MAEMTEQEAEALRQQLAAHDHALRLAAVQAENARRAAVLDGLAPTIAALDALTAPIAALQDQVGGLATSNLDLANMGQVTVRCFNSMVTRVSRVVADHQPSAEPEPGPASPAG